jgi:pimeloyl-ACP methyl ester carboxylesterase
MNASNPREKFVVAGGFKTRYVEGGGERDIPVVLLHDGGFGATAETSWEGVMQRLVQAGHHVIALDMLGFGGTEKAHFFDRTPVQYRSQHILAFCAELRIARAHFVGTSFGGTLLMRALTMKEAWPFASACSIAGTGGPWRVPEAMAAISEYDGTLDSMAKIVSCIADPAHSSFDYPSYLLQRHAASLIPGHYASLAAARLRAPWEDGVPSAQADAYPGSLAGCNVPLLLIEATEDPTCQPNWPANITKVLPSARVERVSGRHSPNIDRPDVVAEILIAWFEQSLAQAPGEKSHVHS